MIAGPTGRKCSRLGGAGRSRLAGAAPACASSAPSGHSLPTMRNHLPRRALAALTPCLHGWGLSEYAGYSAARWPTNLGAERFADKAALFMAYDRAVILANPTWTAYRATSASGRGSSPAQAISALFSRTYVRPAGFAGRSP